MGFLRFEITLTWSKIVALILAAFAFVLDLKYQNVTGTVFMFTVPFIVFLITGKQLIDKKNNNAKIQ